MALLMRAVSLVLIFIIRLRWPPDISIAVIINQRYNRSVLNTYRSYEKAEFKYRKLKADLCFLRTCSENDIIPGFLNFKVYNPRVKSSQVYKDAQHQFLQNEIQKKEKEIRQMDLKKKKLQEDLKCTTSFLDYTHLVNLSERATLGKIASTIAIHSKKLHKLGYREAKHLPPDKVIFNFSSRVLNDAEKSLLSKGLQFVLPPKRLSLEKYLLTFEKLYRSIDKYPIHNHGNFNSETFKTDLRHLAFNSYKDFKKKVPNNVLSEEELVALKSLSKDKSIVISRPDKGNGVVLMDKSDYKNKVHNLLEDTSKFKKITIKSQFSKILSEKDRINRFVNKLFGGTDSNGKHSATYRELHVTGPSLGVLYGLPKIHKEGCPIRPILSACNTPQYSLAKYLVPILSPLTKNIYTTPDSFSFAKELCNLDYKFETVMASFDVKSLFTNIPLHETLDIIEDKFFKDGNEFVECSLKGNDPYNLTRPQFRDLLEKATLDNHFTFDSNTYKQIDGVAMGSPLGPTLANAFMCHMEEKWLSECPSQFKPLFYRRYVDDTFLIFKSQTHITPFLEYLNSRHSNIQFTCDLEKDSCLPFLDINIKRINNTLSTSIYRKPTFTGLLSKYESFAPILYKKNLVSTLTFRAFKLCSNYVNFDKEIKFIKNILQNNGYPLRFVELHISKTLNRLYTPFGSQEKLNYDVPKPIVLFPTYFLGDVSKRVSSEMMRLISTYYPQIRLRMIYKSSDRIGGRFQLKDKAPEDCMSCIIYKYNCDSCKAFYIGKTEQNFRSRICQHQGISDRTGSTSSKPVGSDIRDHCLKHKQGVNPSNFSIIDRIYFRGDICTLESLHQKTKKPTIGTQTQSTPLIMFP